MADFLTRLVQRTLSPAPQVRPLVGPMYAPGPALPEPDALEVQEERELRSEEGPPVFHAGPGAEHTTREDRPRSRLDAADGRPAPIPAETPAPPASLPPVDAIAAASLQPPPRHETLPSQVGGEAQLPTSPIEAPVPPVSTARAPTEQTAVRAPGERPRPGPLPAEARPERIPAVEAGAQTSPPGPPPVETSSGRRARPRAPRPTLDAGAAREAAPIHAPTARTVQPVRLSEEARALVPEPEVERSPTGEAEAGRRIQAVRHEAAGSIVARERHARRPAESPAPVIRVTIGRVEVRAVTPPAPAPRAPARPAPALSLDDYLKQQSGRPQ